MEARYIPSVFEAPKMDAKSRCLIRPRIWEKITVPIIIKAAERILVCRCIRSDRLFCRKLLDIVFYSIAC